MGATGTARSGSGESRVSWDFRHWRDPPTRGRGRRKRSGTCAGPRATLPPQSVGASRRQRTAAVGHRPRKCPRSEGRNLSRPVSRILCDRLRGPAVIPLGRRLPGGSSDLNPEAWDEPPASLFGLAPGGVYRASAVTGGSGELLPHRFTLTPVRRPGRFVFCGTVPASRRAVIIGHPALWSPDFPPAPLG